eukprot:536508-Amphidinium_carterae.1
MKAVQPLGGSPLTKPLRKQIQSNEVHAAIDTSHKRSRKVSIHTQQLELLDTQLINKSKTKTRMVGPESGQNSAAKTAIGHFVFTTYPLPALLLLLAL